MEFIRSLQDRKDSSLAALRREGMVIETMFLERRDDGHCLYYYVKARDLARANEVNMQATDPFTMEIRKFVADTWGDISSPEPLLDLDLIKEEAREAKPGRGKSKAAAPSPHALTGG